MSWKTGTSTLRKFNPSPGLQTLPSWPKHTPLSQDLLTSKRMNVLWGSSDLGLNPCSVCPGASVSSSLKGGGLPS